MKPTRLGTALVLAASGALALSACGSSSNNSSGTTPTSGASSSAGTSSSSSGSSGSGGAACSGSGSISGQGSTFQKNFEAQAIKDFGSACPSIKVDYQGTGSGAGIKAFGQGQVAFAGSDSLMKDDEQAAADKNCGGNKAWHLPLTAGAVVFTYNLQGVDNLQLSPKSIADIFQGKVKNWDDAELKADNPGVDLPGEPIQVSYRNDSSGTTDIISKFLTATAGSDWTLGTGKDIKFPVGTGAKGSDGVTNAVKGNDGGITYTELSYAVANQLPTAKVKNGGGQFVAPTGDAASAALTTAKVDTSAGDVRVKPDYATTNPAAYPVTAPSYVIVCSKGGKDAAAVKSYLTFATGSEQSKAGSIGYAPLPPSILSAETPLIAQIG